MTSFSIPGRPVPAARARAGNGRFYNTPKYDAWLQRVALEARVAHDGPLWTGGVAMGLDIAVPDLKHGDQSNYTKGIEDGAERAGALFRDDKQIVATVAMMRLDRANPGITAHFAPANLVIAYTMYQAMQIFASQARNL